MGLYVSAHSVLAVAMLWLGCCCLLLPIAWTGCNAFVLNPTPTLNTQAYGVVQRWRPISPASSSSSSAWSRSGATEEVHTLLMMAKKAKSKKKSFIERMNEIDAGRVVVTPEPEEGKEPEVRVFSADRLNAEAKTPWRTVRIFIFGGFAFSALIGGFTAATQLAATLANQPDSLPLQQALTNVGIDFGVAAVSAIAIKYELDAVKDKQEVEAKIRTRKQKIKQNKLTDAVNEQRVKALRELTVKLQMDEDTKQEVQVGKLMSGARQSFVVVAGTRPFVDKATLSSALAPKKLFVGGNIVVVPVVLQEGPENKGFAPKKLIEAPHIVEPGDETQEGWDSLMVQELSAAVAQGSTLAQEEGIVLVVKKDGKILRRGVGQPDWALVAEDISGKVDKKP